MNIGQLYSHFEDYIYRLYILKIFKIILISKNYVYLIKKIFLLIY